MCRTSPIAVLALTMLMALSAAAQQAGKTDQDKLQGVWRVLTIEVDGRYVPDEQAEKFKVAVAKDKLILGMAGKERLTRYKLDAMASPKTIDLTGVDDGQTALGIYGLDGDSLKISLAQPGTKK